MVCETLIRLLRYGLLIASIAGFIYGIIEFFTKHNKNFMSLNRRLLIFALWLILSSLLIQIAINFSGEPKLKNLIEYISNCFVNTMQMFSLDADYDKIIEKATAVTSNYSLGKAIGIYASIVNILASVIGGAILLDVLTGIFPSVRLFLYASLNRNKKLYVFSELNECSLVLAEDIYSKRTSRNGFVIVFTDAYIDDEDEKQSELLVRAGNIGAICLEDDIVHCQQLQNKKCCNIFLMDGADSGNDDESNLTTMCELLSEDMAEFWREKDNCMLFLFTGNEETIRTANHVKNTFDVDKKNSGKLVFRTVSTDKQVALRQMVQLPLFTPLKNRENDSSLHVVLFGNNSSAKEMFKAVFWCGQTLYKKLDGEFGNRKLKITVVYSPENTENKSPARADFCDYINREMPELIPCCTPGDECLRIFWDKSKNEFAPTYCELSFIETRLDSLNVKELLESVQTPEPGFGTANSEFYLKDADYFIIMSGNNSVNIDIAWKIRKALKQIAFNSQTGTSKDRVVAYEISSHEMKIALNGRDTGMPVKMNAFGSLKDRYCWSNVVMDDIFLANGNQDKLSGEHWYGADRKIEVEDKSREVSYQRFQNINRQVHEIYKQFSASCNQETEYERKCDYIKKIEEDKKLTYALAWLEKRRWNAYTRCCGLTYPGDDKIMDPKSAYKNLEIDIHPSLVEAYLRKSDSAEEIEKYESDKLFKVSCKRAEGKNALDEAALKAEGYKVKNYDFPGEKNAPGFTKAETLCRLGITDNPSASIKETERCWKALTEDHPEIESEKGGIMNKYGYYHADKIESIDVQKYKKLFERHITNIGNPDVR